MSPVATTGSMKSLKDLLIEQINELHASEMHSEPVLAKLAAAAASPAPVLQQATLNAYFSPAAAGSHRSTRMAMMVLTVMM